MNRFSMIVLCVLPTALSAGETETLVDEFDGEFRLDWEIAYEDKELYSLSENEGELTIQTAQGTINRDWEQKNAPDNIFLIKDPIEGDFEHTLRVNHFAPTDVAQQLRLLAYQTNNDYVCLTYMRKREADRTVLTWHTESSGELLGRKKRVVKFDGPFWLRMKRQEDDVSLLYSDDGDEFVELQTISWEPTIDEPIRVGFMAVSGPSDTTTTAQIESYSLTRDVP